ncbi:hypothetical protein SLEP1_g47408 [Rubroshorea leprosula]|uniref:Uncharacterized protein n=1 Tax=Rubroshorea leprosula TaxID=152421 RepID=A0AAV5LQB0_9ROSI|nr:hypothetical protein SLEP1_g47408 [Rubroshorea leprosula]
MRSFKQEGYFGKAEKWKHASEEEEWLEEYEMDENRYSEGRGAHKNLKCAEKARILVGEITTMVENLTMKVKVWEMEKGIPFLYDEAPFLHMLGGYSLLQQERGGEA